MRKAEEIIRDLGICASDECDSCGLRGKMMCRSELVQEAYKLLSEVMPDGGEPERCQESWTREQVLDKAKVCVCGRREQDYGSPENSFSLIAELWSSYLRASCIGGTFDLCINPENVAAMMALLKVARLAATPSHMDSWADLAGYAACGGEIASEKAKE